MLHVWNESERRVDGRDPKTLEIPSSLPARSSAHVRQSMKRFTVIHYFTRIAQYPPNLHVHIR